MCRQGSEDLALVEVILSMASRSEVADTCQSYLGNKAGKDSCHSSFSLLYMALFAFIVVKRGLTPLDDFLSLTR